MLNVARAPQGRPVLVQAGASEEGKELPKTAAKARRKKAPALDGAIKLMNPRADFTQVVTPPAREGQAPRSKTSSGTKLPRS